MQLHIVGGFLGSGKTTGILTAAQYLIANGKKIGVVTNDRGKHLVDSMFFHSQDILTVEIAQGCFRCNIDELVEKLTRLKKNEKPDIVFAESVGSCGDLVATVIKPLGNLDNSETPPTSYSVFTDSQFLHAYLEGVELPFSENVIYIFEKQIEEANILIINKVDLLTERERIDIFELVKKKYPSKVIRFQNSRNKEDVIGWINTIENNAERLPFNSIDINYKKYGLGEVSLAWLEQHLLINTNGLERKTVVKELIYSIQKSLIDKKIGIGHLKLFVSSEENIFKVSIATNNRNDWENELINLRGSGEINLLINARIEMPADELLSLFKFNLLKISTQLGISIEFIHEMAFNPSLPKIPMRIPNSDEEIKTINIKTFIKQRA